MGPIVFSAAALVIAFCGLIATIVGLRRKTEESYTDTLEARLRIVESDLEVCKRARIEMQDREKDLLHSMRVLKEENFSLMAKLLNLPGGPQSL